MSLTIKLIENNGHELVYSGVKNVGAEPTVGACHAVIAYLEDECKAPLNFSGNGVLYVMNEGGQTVAKYIL